MPIPRFRDTDGDYEVVLWCPKCGWAVAKDRFTQEWKECRVCGGRPETKRVDYRQNPYGRLEYR